jgi:hypothetical protein
MFPRSKPEENPEKHAVLKNNPLESLMDIPVKTEGNTKYFTRKHSPRGENR